MRYLVANWKSHKTLTEGQHWLEQFTSLFTSQEITVILAASYIQLAALKDLARSKGLSLAAQDISPFPDGAYTGAVSARQLQDLVNYVLVGHSERRHWFHETHQDIANKIDQALNSNLNPILCVDTPYASAQFAAISPHHWPRLIIAYEPLAAISSGDPQNPQAANQVAADIKKTLGDSVPVLYGGSTTPANVADLLSQPYLAGILVGQASLDPHLFAQIVKHSL